MFMVNAVAGAIPGVKSLTSRGGGSSKSSRMRTDADDDTPLEELFTRTALEKTRLDVKSSTAKDLFTTSNLAVRSGALMKKNEQGVWHAVEASLVPHWFLYYYDKDKEDCPKGIIDSSTLTPA